MAFSVRPDADLIRKRLNEMCPVAKLVGLGDGLFDHEAMDDALADAVSERLSVQPTRAYQTLVVSGVVADAQTITIGDDVYEIDQVNTDTTKSTANNAGAALAADGGIQVIEMEDSAHGLSAGDLIRIGTEVMFVIDEEGEFLTVIRGWGTEPDSHARDADVFESAAGYTATRIPVPIVGAATGADDFCDVFPATYISAVTYAEETGIDVVETHLDILRLSASMVLALAKVPGSDNTDTLENGTNLDWNGDTMVGGSSGGFKSIHRVTHTVTANEADGIINIPMLFEPDVVIIEVWQSGAPVAHDVEWSYVDTAPSHLVLDDNTTLTAGDILSVVALY